MQETEKMPAVHAPIASTIPSESCMLTESRSFAEQQLSN